MFAAKNESEKNESSVEQRTFACNSFFISFLVSVFCIVNLCTNEYSIVFCIFSCCCSSCCFSVFCFFQVIYFCLHLVYLLLLLSNWVESSVRRYKIALHLIAWYLKFQLQWEVFEIVQVQVQFVEIFANFVEFFCCLPDFGFVSVISFISDSTHVKRELKLGRKRSLRICFVCFVFYLVYF